MTRTAEITARLEYLRGELRAERISCGELAELESLAEHIEPGDTELLEAAGVPEHADGFEPEHGQQTFSDEHWRALAVAFAEGFGDDALAALYRGSYSSTFPADLRAMLRQQATPAAVERWEGDGA